VECIHRDIGHRSACPARPLRTIGASEGRCPHAEGDNRFDERLDGCGAVPIGWALAAGRLASCRPWRRSRSAARFSGEGCKSLSRIREPNCRRQVSRGGGCSIVRDRTPVPRLLPGLDRNCWFRRQWHSLEWLGRPRRVEGHALGKVSFSTLSVVGISGLIDAVSSRNAEQHPPLTGCSVRRRRGRATEPACRPRQIMLKRCDK